MRRSRGERAADSSWVGNTPSTSTAGYTPAPQCFGRIVGQTVPPQFVAPLSPRKVDEQLLGCTVRRCPDQPDLYWTP